MLALPEAGVAVPSAPQADPAPTAPSPLLSVVVPVRNEAANVGPLLDEIAAALKSVPHEVLVVDDGSTDDTMAALAAAAPRHPALRRLRHLSNAGQSAAIRTGVRAARGHWIATLDGDGQNDPADIPRLLARARAEAAAGPVLIAGHRTRRRDGAIKRVTSTIANRVRARLLGDATPDTGCGLKLFPRALFLELPAFDHMHRFLPALALRAGARVVSEPVGHRPRLRGRSNYGTLDRLAVSLFDLAGVAWLQRRGRRPIVEEVVPEAQSFGIGKDARRRSDAAARSAQAGATAMHPAISASATAPGIARDRTGAESDGRVKPGHDA